MQRKNARIQFLIVIVLFAIAVLLTFSRYAFSGGLTTRFQDDMYATQTAQQVFQQSVQASATSYYATSSSQTSIFATATNTIDVSATPTSTLHPQQVIETFLAQTSTMWSPTIPPTLDMQGLFATPLVTATPIVGGMTPIFSTPSPVPTGSPTGTPYPIEATLTAHYDWITKQVESVETNAYPGLATAAANMIGTATAFPTVTIPPTPTLFGGTVYIPPDNSGRSSNTVSEIAQAAISFLKDQDLDEVPYTLLVWVIPGLLAAWLIGKEKKALSNQNSDDFYTLVFFIIYSSALLLSAYNDYLGGTIKLSETYDSSILSLLGLTTALGAISILSSFWVREMSKGFDLVEWVQAASTNTSPPTYSIREKYLLFGAGLVTFLDFGAILIYWGIRYGGPLSLWGYIGIGVAYLYFLLLEYAGGGPERKIWQHAVNALLLPFVALFRLLVQLIQGLLIPDVAKINWVLVLIKFLAAASVFFIFIPFFLRLPTAEEFYLGDAGLNFVEALFFGPGLALGWLFKTLQDLFLIEFNTAYDPETVFAMAMLWAASLSITVYTLAWVVESISRSIPHTAVQKKSGLLSNLTWVILDVISTWFLIVAITGVVFYTIGKLELLPEFIRADLPLWGIMGPILSMLVVFLASQIWRLFHIGSKLPYRWYAIVYGMVREFLAIPIWTVTRLFLLVFNVLAYLVILFGAFLGSYPAILDNEYFPFTPEGIQQLQDVILEYDGIVIAIQDKSFGIFWIMAAFCVVLTLWVSWGEIIKLRKTQSSGQGSTGTFVYLLFTNFILTLAALASYVLVSRFLNLGLFLLPGIPLGYVPVKLAYPALLFVLAMYSFAAMFLRDKKQPLSAVIVLPATSLTAALQNRTAPVVTAGHTAQARETFGRILGSAKSLLVFLFMPHPYNRGRLDLQVGNIAIPKIRFRLLLGNGFYAAQSLLFALMVWALSGFSSAVLKDLRNALLLALFVFAVWLLSKRSHDKNHFRNFRLLIRLAGTALFAYSVTWLLWSSLFGIFHLFLLATLPLGSYDFATVRIWLQGQPVLMNIRQWAPAVLFILFAWRMIANASRSQWSGWKKDLQELVTWIAQRSPLSLFQEFIQTIKNPRWLPERLPVSYFFLLGLIFHLLAGVLALPIAIWLYPSIYSPLQILDRTLGTLVSMLVALPFVVLLSTSPIMYVRYYHPLIMEIVDRFESWRSLTALVYRVPRYFSHPGYRRSLQYTFLTFFFAHGLGTLLLGTIRIFFWQVSAWNDAILGIEVLFTLILGFLLAANFTRTIPILSILVGALSTGPTYFMEPDAAVLLLVFTTAVFLIAFAVRHRPDTSWTNDLLYPQRLLMRLKNYLYRLDLFEKIHADFSRLILVDSTLHKLETTRFKDRFASTLEQYGAREIGHVDSLKDPMKDPIRQSLLLFACSAVEEFRLFANQRLFSSTLDHSTEDTGEAWNHVNGIVRQIHAFTQLDVDSTLQAVIQLERIQPPMPVNISPIQAGKYLPLPFDGISQSVLDFRADERSAIETYLDKSQPLPTVIELWSLLAEKSVLAAELCSLYKSMKEMSEVNRLDAIAVFSQALRKTVIRPDSVMQDLYQALLRLANVAEIIERASGQRIGHRSHEYSFALKQLQVVRSVHVPRLESREQSFLLILLDRWVNLITEALIYEPALPQLFATIESAQLRQAAEETLILAIENVGESAALDVHIELSPSEGLIIKSQEAPFIVEEILGRSTVRLEFTVVLLRNEDAELVARINYLDVWQKQYSLSNISTRVAYASPENTSLPFTGNIANPYVYGPAVSGPNHFFGRERTLLTIEQRFQDTEQTRIVMLYGQRRMGKSSVLKNVANKYLQRKEWWPIYIDGATIFAKEVSELILALATRIWNKLPDGHSVPEPKLDDFRIDPGHALVNQFLPMVDESIRKTGKTLLILFDEFDTYIKSVQGRFPAEEIQQVLWVTREFAQALSTGGFMYAGTFELLDMSRQYQAPFFNLAEQIKVGPLDEKAARDLICTPGGRYLKFNEDAIQKIMRLSGCHPYFIQLLCNKIFDLAVNENTHVVGVRLVNQAIPEAQEQENAFFNIWAERNPEQKLTLAAMAHIINYEGFLIPVTRMHNILESSYISISIDILQTAVDRLVEEEILTRDNDLYGFSVDLLRLWIKSKKSLRSVRAEINYQI